MWLRVLRRDRQGAHRCSGVPLGDGEVELRLEVQPELGVHAGTSAPAARAVLPVTERLPATIRLMRLGGTSMARANAVGLTPSSSNSSFRISPGAPRV